MSYADKTRRLMTVGTMGECPLLRHGRSVNIAAEADAEIAKLKARIRELAEWRPMETAPKGGPILGFGQGVCCQIFWNKGAWYTDVGNSYLFYPTGWLPVPRSEAP